MGWTGIINIYVKIRDILRGIMYNQIVPQKRHRMDERYFYYEKDCCPDDGCNYAYGILRLHRRRGQANAQDLISTLPAEGGKPVVTDTPTPTEAPVATEEPTAEPTAEAETSITRGTWTDGVYYNATAGFNFTPPENWLLADDEYIAQLVGVSKEMLGTEGEDLSDHEVVYDTFVQNPDNGTNVFIIYQKVSMLGALGMGIGDIMDEIVKQMGENTAMNCTYVGTTEQTLGSTDYQCAEFDVDISGITIKQYILVNKFMNYTTNITITAMASEPIEEFLPMFTSAQTAMADCCG